MTTRLSTASGARLGAPLLLGLGALAAAGSLGGCVDPKGALDDFAGRVVDASPPADAPSIGSLPDVTGQFLMGLSPGFQPDLIMRLIVDFELTINEDGTGVLNVSSQPVSVADGMPVGEPLVVSDVAVSENGIFGAEIAGTVNGAASELMNDFTFTSIFEGQLRTVDVVCGTVSGMVTSPATIPLDGSTFGAIRIVTGTVGNDNLPEPQITCPASSDIDAGVDAAPPDAAPPDAATPDATPPDAAPPDAPLPDAGV